MEHDESLPLVSNSQNSSPLNLRSLKFWQSAAAVFMLAQAIIVLILPLGTKVPVTIDFPDRDGENDSGPIGVPSFKILGAGLHVKYLIFSFLLLSGVDHFLWSVILWLQSPNNFFGHFLEKTLFKSNNPLRWIEYTFSASLMTILVAALSGIYNTHALLLVAEFTAVTMLLGWVIELIPKGKQRVISGSLFAIASATCLFAWIPIFCYFFQAMSASSGDVPGFVIVAFLITFLAYCAFAINMFLYYFASLYSFHTAEVLYILLSFTAKTVLAWDVWGGFKAAA